MIASVVAQPDVPSSVRTVSAASPRAIVAPIAAKRYLLKVTISDTAQQDLERAKALLRHVIPSGDPAALVERALALLARDAERTKASATSNPRRSSLDEPRSNQRPHRAIPANVKRAGASPAS
jgi:hypothetical protein